MTELVELEKYLLVFEPEQYLPRFVRTVRDLYENRFIVRTAPCNDFVVAYVAGLILEAGTKKERFRVFDCLKLLRCIIRNSTPAATLSAETIDVLFSLYQWFIFSPKDEINWCVSTYIKDRPLRESQVLWLIDNAAACVHLVNRLLRYPEPNPIVANWALRTYVSGAMPNRTAELLGVLIQEDIPSFASHEHPDTLIWAIYYAKASPPCKETLLLKIANEECISSALEVALRLRLPNVIRGLCEVVRSQTG